MRLIALAIIIMATTGCARMKESIQNIPFGMRVKVPGIELGFDNDVDGVDFIFDTNYEQPLMAIKSLLFDMPRDMLTYGAQVSNAALDPNIDITDGSTVSASDTKDLELNEETKKEMDGLRSNVGFGTGG